MLGCSQSGARETVSMYALLWSSVLQIIFQKMSLFRHIRNFSEMVLMAFIILRRSTGISDCYIIKTKGNLKIYKFIFKKIFKKTQQVKLYGAQKSPFFPSMRIIFTTTCEEPTT